MVRCTSPFNETSFCLLIMVAISKDAYITTPNFLHSRFKENPKRQPCVCEMKSTIHHHRRHQARVQTEQWRRLMRAMPLLPMHTGGGSQRIHLPCLSFAYRRHCRFEGLEIRATRPVDEWWYACISCSLERPLFQFGFLLAYLYDGGTRMLYHATKLRRWWSSLSSSRPSRGPTNWTNREGH